MGAHAPLFAGAGAVAVMPREADLDPEVLQLGHQDLRIRQIRRDLEPAGLQGNLDGAG